MTERIVALIIDESKWLTASLGLAVVVVGVGLYRLRNRNVPQRQLILISLNLLFGVTIGTMAFGHLLAVSTKLLLGTLEGSILLLYLIGVVLAVPSWLLIYHAGSRIGGGAIESRKTLVLNTWLVLTLVALGLPNLPLAIPGLLNATYQKHRRPAIGWFVVGVSAVVTIGLFIGSVVFLMSGQSFEEFRGMP